MLTHRSRCADVAGIYLSCPLRINHPGAPTAGFAILRSPSGQRSLEWSSALRTGATDRSQRVVSAAEEFVHPESGGDAVAVHVGA
jgi:hypothetical protein